MTKEQQKDKIIEIVKKAIGETSLYNYDKKRGEFIAQINCDDVDHIAEEVAGNIYNFYHPIDEVAEYKPDEDIGKTYHIINRFTAGTYPT